MPIDLTDALDAMFRNEPGSVADPDALWRRLREGPPVHAHRSVLLVSSYRGVHDVLRDQERFSGRWAFRGSFADAFRASLSAAQITAFEQFLVFEERFMRHNDDPDHARLRALVQRAFAPRAVAALRSNLESVADELLEGLAKEPRVELDLAGFAYTFPLCVVGDLLGVPREDNEQVHAWSGQVAAGLQIQAAERFSAACTSFAEFSDYLRQRFDAPHGSRIPSPLEACLQLARSEGSLDDEGAAAIAVNLLFAGHETTANLVGIGVLELLHSPGAWEWLAEDPRRIPAAVEELLRFVTPTQWEKRVARVDTEIEGFTIPAETTVFPIIAAANRDPRKFPRPDLLDLGRSNASAHLSFGFGVHHCLGAGLARLEAEVAFSALVRRFPRLQLAEREPEWEGIGGLRRLRHLPVLLAG